MLEGDSVSIIAEELLQWQCLDSSNKSTVAANFNKLDWGDWVCERIVLFTLTNYLNELHQLTSSNPKAFSYFIESQLLDHSNALCWLLSF